MFIDKAKIYVKGGDGGNGIVAFRREKFVPAGGPSGGDGGKGGNVVLKVDEGLKSLMDFKYNIHIKAERGTHGSGSHQHGKSGEDSVVFVPPGTVVLDYQTGEIIADLILQDQTFIVAHGGRGGRGNARFATQKNKAPDFSEEGYPGEEKWIVLELKVLADVGLVGVPNAGKSTLLRKVTEAKPKVANYHFTTINPHLGVVDLDAQRFTLADIPGLIQGAHQGKGLGDQFLKHIERTQLIAHVIDMAGIEGRNPVDDFFTVEAELAQFSPELVNKPRLIIANKMDLGDMAEHNLQNFIQTIENREKVNVEIEGIFPISAVTGTGIEEMLKGIAAILTHIPDTAKKPEKSGSVDVEEIDAGPYRKIEDEEYVQYTMASGTASDGEKDIPQVEKEGTVFYVYHKDLEDFVQRVDVFTEEGQKAFQEKADEVQLEALLRKKGIKEGDTVKIGELEFVYQA